MVRLNPLRNHTRRRARAAAVVVLVGGLLAGISPSVALEPTPDTSYMPKQLDAWTTITRRTTTEPVAVTNGVTFSSEVIDSVAGRVPVHMVKVDTKDPNVRLRTVVSNDRVVDPANEVLTSMADRTGAVAGLNAGFFDIHASGQAVEGEIVDGEIWKSPTPNFEGTLAVLKDGSVVYGTQTFSGTITAGGTSRPLTSVNRINDATGDGVTLVTPRLGEVTSTWLKGPKLAALGTSTDGGATITVTSIAPVTALPAGQYGLLAGDANTAGGKWLQANLKVGSTVATTTAISPNNDIQQLVQGGGRILKDGAVHQDPTRRVPSGLHPESALGSTADGQLMMVALDGQRTAEVALGVHWTHVASYLQDLGVKDAILLDGGGSTEVVARKPGDKKVSILNSPSDLQERPVANGLFVYSTATAAGPAVEVSVNDGAGISTAVGADVRVPVRAVDDAGNPAADQPVVTVRPESLGTWENGTFVPKGVGMGTISARAGAASASVPVRVTSAFDELTVSPATGGAKNGESLNLVVKGRNGGDDPVTVAPGSVEWTLDQPELGAFDAATGRFTAAATGNGEVSVKASVGGREASADIRVGAMLKTLLVADNAADWKLRATGEGVKINPAGPHPAETTDVPPGSSQTKALTVDFSFPNSPGQNRIWLQPNNGAGLLADKNEFGQVPENLYFKFKLETEAPPQSWMVLNVKDAVGHNMGLWVELTKEHYGQWTELSKSIKRGVFTDYPLTISDISFVGQYATNASEGKFSFGGFTVDYPSGTATVDKPYEGINSNNPEWLRFEQDAANFKPGGQTFVMGDDGHLVASNPGSTSALNIETLSQRFKGNPTTTSEGQTVEPLPEVARPEVAVSLGDISDTGNIDDLQFAKEQWEKFGAPLYDVVGNHEISQGVIPANTNFHEVFKQDTHYTFTRPGMTFIAVDNSTGSIGGSDAQQVPKQEQFPWFVKALEDVQTPVVFIGIHMPSYDPSPSRQSQASNRWEAEQFVQTIDNYKKKHPDKRVVVLHGHSRGFANQVIDPFGNDSADGIPTFTIGDIGMPPYFAAAEGGFYHFALFHVNEDGTVQFTVEPMLKSITMDQGATDTLKVGSTKVYSATAVNANGDNIAKPPVMPVANPMSHVWESSDPSVATVDAVTGEVTAVSEGEATISVRAGGIRSGIKLAVTSDQDVPAPSPTVTVTVTETASVPVPGPTVTETASVPGPTVTAGPTVTVTVTVPPSPTASPSLPPKLVAPYEVAGFHNINGRRWFTRCEKYSQTQRCRTDIWATQVTQVDGRFVQKTGWFFNNLTYLPFMTEAQWGSNPLANPGQFRSADGRQWRTECHTPATGKGACRSYVMSSFIKSTRRADGTWSYALTKDWVFNNIVRFRAS